MERNNVYTSSVSKVVTRIANMAKTWLGERTREHKKKGGKRKEWRSRTLEEKCEGRSERKKERLDLQTGSPFVILFLFLLLKKGGERERERGKMRESEWNFEIIKCLKKKPKKFTSFTI